METNYSTWWACGDGQADVSGEQAQSQEIFGYLLILVHFGMVVAIVVEAYFGMQVKKWISVLDSFGWRVFPLIARLGVSSLVT